VPGLQGFCHGAVPFPICLSRCPLLVEFALAALKIALNRWNPTFLLPFISGNLVLLICGLDRAAWPLPTSSDGFVLQNGHLRQ
jgi:hypothetical protein